MMTETEKRARALAVRKRLGMPAGADEVYWTPAAGEIMAFELLLDRVENLEAVRDMNLKITS